MKHLPIFFVLSLFILSCNNAQKNNSTIRIFRNDTIAGSNLAGYGYDIFVDGAFHIHQPHIPAISGSKGFSSAEDARKTAEYVVKKLKNTKDLPAIKKEELDNLGIKY